MKRSTMIAGCALVVGWLMSVPAGGQETGSIVGWGNSVVVPQSELTDLVAIAAGGYRSLALKSDGSIVAWGANWGGQCNVPAPNSGFVAVAAGYFHNLGLKGAFLRGDRNCDGAVNFRDINPFVLALTNASVYVQQFPDRNIYRGDINGDGFVDFVDINPFVMLLAGS